MEAVAAGASVIAVIELALKCSQSLYQTLSSYQNGPQQIKSLASAVSNLHAVLIRLQTCEALKNAKANLQSITNLIKACHEDLLRYQKLLRKVQPAPKTSKVRQALKRYTAILEEKGLKQIWTEVNHHYTALVVELQILQS